MPERERAYHKDQLVTILDGKIGRHGKVTIRNAYGYVEEVPAKELTKIDKSEPESVLHYGLDQD